MEIMCRLQWEMKYCVNVNSVKLVDGVVQFFWILADFVCWVLKSLTVIVELSVSPFSSIRFCLIYFEALLLCACTFNIVKRNRHNKIP